MGNQLGVFGDPQFWKDVGNNTRNLPSRLAAYGGAAMERAMEPSDQAVTWSDRAVPGRFAEGKQDAARHTEWTAGTAAALENMARYGTMALPEGLANHLSRGIGAVGALGVGAGIEAVGLGKAALKAGNQAMSGKFDTAGRTLNEGWESTKMDLNNNLAGAAVYSQIKDPAARRAAILEAVHRSQVQPNPGHNFDGSLSGELVRRR